MAQGGDGYDVLKNHQTAFLAIGRYDGGSDGNSGKKVVVR